MPLIAILSTGDEIIYGDTLNTNTHALAHSLSAEGLSTGLHLSCSDQEQDIVDCLSFLGQKHDIIILTGGLGPTSDDRTRFALSRYLSKPLVEHADALMHVQTLLARANLACNAGNRQQALFPVDAQLLPNMNGTAMGCLLAVGNRQFILLPGPPRECLPMFNAYVLPVLQTTQHHNKQLLKWRLFGVAEGAIAQILDEALSNVDCETGYRLETPYVEFKVRCRAEQVAVVNQIIEPLVASFIIAPPEHRASECLLLRINELQIPIIIIDEVTGGILQTLLQRPDNSHLLKFRESCPEPVDLPVVLRFHLRGLDEYWEQKIAPITHVHLDYRAGQEQGSETHQLAYRNRLVVEHAAEWLSFRLLHFINQLHQCVT